MTEFLQTKPEKKPGRPSTKEIEDRVALLELVIVKMAHFTGTQRIILEAGLKPFTPGRDDMSKYKN
jgi:hypothetical protein